MTAGPGRIEAVVFDLDGTLADTMALAPRAYADTIRCLGGPEVSPDEVVTVWHMGSTPVVLGHFLRRAVTPKDISCFYGSFESVIAAVRPFPGIPGMLSSLRREGYRLGIFTHATRRAATMTLTGAGLDHFQLTLVGGEEIAEPKPAPEGLQLACRRMNVAPAAVAYVGDAEVDLQCAAAGVGPAAEVRAGAAGAAGTTDYSVDPQAIGRLVGVTASPDTVAVRCDGQVVASHSRSWAKTAVITDPAHQAAAARMRQALAADRAARERARPARCGR